jgi:glycosyltransferase involved in cell wall biosynthesis
VPERARILLLVTLAETGGAQSYVASLVPELVGWCDVTVAAHGDGPLRAAAARAGADFVPLRHVRRPLHAARDLRGLLELLALMRRLRPHLVHANSSKAGVLGRVAARLAGVPARVLTVHGWAFNATTGPASHLYLWAERAARPLATATICVSESERAAGLAARTCDAERTLVVPNAIPLDGRALASPGREPAKLVSVGRLQSPKDPLALVRALARLRGREFRALLVGDGPLRPAVEEEIRRSGLDANVELAGERQDVARLLARSQLFVLSSRSEAMPITVLEAMAAGLPVVATRVGGMPELVREGESGLLVRPGDADELARALARLLDDPKARERFGRAARARVEREFAFDSFVQAHLDLYGRQLAHVGVSLPAP